MASIDTKKIIAFPTSQGMIFADALACITGGIAEAFYGMPPKLQQETLKRLPEKMRAAYELFRRNLKRKM